MSQPEMYPDEAPREEGTREDLRALPFPLGDWGEPAERLEELYCWAEESALHSVDWYLADRTGKRRGARTLRAVSVVCAVVGGVMALAGWTQWGFIGVLLSASCIAADRLFGLTAGWMRDVSTAQAIQRRLEALRYDWAAESVREVLGPTEGTAAEAAERCLGVLRRFSEDLSDLVRLETADWMVDFRAGSAALRTQSSWWGSRAADTTPASRFPLPPGGRPTMPRQRPPEGPPR